MATINVNSTLAAYANLTIIRTGEVDGSEKAKLEKSVQNAVTWSADQAVQVVFENKQAVAVVGVKQPGIVYENGEPSSPRLRLLKLASTNHALPGEEVEFTLRFDNVGDQVIGNVTIVDNLATRLEYVAASAKSSAASGFSAVPNDARLDRASLGDQGPGQGRRGRHPAIHLPRAVKAAPQNADEPAVI